MIIDFTDIPPSNKGGKYQDLFEQFACVFLEAKGFEIIQRPDRGADGKKDLLVREIRNGVSGTSEIMWLVSCKHNAHSNKSVNDVDEPDVSDRVRKFNCDGFIGFYSTIPSSTLANKLHSLKTNFKQFNYLIYDSSRISNELLNMNQSSIIIANFFPNSYENFKRLNISTRSVENNESFEIQLGVVKTALIILEIDKIEEKIQNETLSVRLDLLNQLFKYYKHRNEEIANSIFDLLYSVSMSIRESKNLKIVEIIKSLVYTYFPSSTDYRSVKIINNGKNCIHLAYNFIYDAIIWINNYEIAINGLLIWKYIYKIAHEHDMKELVKEINMYYQFLRTAINNLERENFVSASTLVNIFEDDLNRSAMDYPDFPQELYKIIFDTRDNI